MSNKLLNKPSLIGRSILGLNRDLKGLILSDEDDWDEDEFFLKLAFGEKVNELRLSTDVEENELNVFLI